MVSAHIIVLTTTGSVEEAEHLGRSLVEARLAACVNVVHPMRSIYRWKGQVQADQEAMLVI
jgi:periplasmic divalent cation tolerance protein